jgi:hypothetical protein
MLSIILHFSLLYKFYTNRLMSIQTSYLQSSHLQIIALKLKTHLPYHHKQTHCQDHIRTYTTPSVDKMTVDKKSLDKMTNVLYFHVDMMELKLGNEALSNIVC